MKTNLLHTAFYTPMANGGWGLPLILWSPPGAAKTSVVRQLAKSYGLHCEHLTPGERGEGAFGVTPVPTQNGKGMVLSYPPPDWITLLRVTIKGGTQGDYEEAGIVFLDELNCLTGDTMVTAVDDNGGLYESPICNMLPGDRVVSFDLERGERRVNKVSHVQHMPAHTIIRVQLADGRTIRATPNHRFYVNGKWVFAADLRPGTNLHLLPDMQQTLSDDHTFTPEDTRDHDAGLQEALPQGSAGGACHAQEPNNESCNGTAATDEGSSLCREEAGAGQTFGRVPRGVIAGGEHSNPADGHQHVSGAIHAAAEVRNRATRTGARSGDPSRHVLTWRDGNRTVLALPKGTPDGIGTRQTQLGGSSLPSEYRAEELGACDLRPHPSHLQRSTAHGSRTANDRLRTSLGDPTALRGGRGASRAHTIGGAQTLEEPRLPDRCAAKDCDLARSNDATRTTGGAGRLHSRGLDGCEDRPQGASGRGDTPPETDNPHQIVEIVAVESLAFGDDVWDLSVEVGHNFYANGILTHNTAPPALQPALLGAIQERRIGGHTFGPRVRMIGAANPVGHAAGGWDLAAPVANRLGHIDWPSPEVDEWGAWMMGGAEDVIGMDSSAEERRVMAAWPEAFAKATGLATAFVRRRPELLHKMPADGSPEQSRAWPSPRSWEYATRARAAAEIHSLSPVETDEFVTAFIGAGPAGEWGQWIDEADLPEPALVLDGKQKFEHNPERLDRTMAVLSSCAALVAPAKAAKRKDRSKALWGILAGVMDDAKDIVVPAMQAMVRAGLQKQTEARPVLAKMHSVVSAAGMTAGGRR